MISFRTYLLDSKQFYDAAHAVVVSDEQADLSFRRSILTLLATSIELNLKGFLRYSGVEEAKLSQSGFRHDLTKMLRRAVDLGLCISESSAIEVIWLSKCYEAQALRYFPEDIHFLRPSQQVFEAAAELASQVLAKTSQDITPTPVKCMTISAFDRLMQKADAEYSNSQSSFDSNVVGGEAAYPLGTVILQRTRLLRE